MELKEATKKVLKIFQCEETSELPDKIMETILNKESEKKLKEYHKLIKETNTDWIQAIYQRNLSDRKIKSQDFTPKSLSKLCSQLTRTPEEKRVYDACAGTGSLTLMKHNDDNNLEFTLWELDEKIIPFLLFNLRLHNIEATVINGDVLDETVFKQYKLKKGKNFSSITLDSSFLVNNFDSCISNPPFNLKTNESLVFKEFDNIKVPKSNNNYSFVLKCLKNAKKGGKVAMILPLEVLSSRISENIRKYLCVNGYIDAVITCPSKMFENTDIPVVIILLTNKKRPEQDIVMINAKETFKISIRDMKGDLHMATRTYHKEVNEFSDKQIKEISTLVETPVTKEGYCKAATINELKKEDYNLSPSYYVGYVEETEHHRNIKDIVDDINRIKRHRNNCKLTCNEKVIRSISPHADKLLEQKKLQEENKRIDQNINESFKMLRENNPNFECDDFINDNYFTISKTKNTLKFENNTKSEVTRDDMIFQLERWRTLVHFLNNEETRYLAELRDALLPKLMNGELNFS